MRTKHIYVRYYYVECWRCLLGASGLCGTSAGVYEELLSVKIAELSRLLYEVVWHTVRSHTMCNVPVARYSPSLTVARLSNKESDPFLVQKDRSFRALKGKVLCPTVTKLVSEIISLWTHNSFVIFTEKL